MIKYNQDKFAELLKKLKKTRADIRRDLGISNDTTVKGWQKGGDIYISKLVAICNQYNISLAEFFLIDDTEAVLSKKTEVEDVIPMSGDVASFMVEKERQIAELKIKHQESLFAVKEEIFQLKIQHEKAIMQNTLSLKELERENLNRQRMQDWELFEAKMKEKEQEIALLKESMMEMQMQYKELEMATSYTTKRTKTTQIANEPGTIFQKNEENKCKTKQICIVIIDNDVFFVYKSHSRK